MQRMKAGKRGSKALVAFLLAILVAVAMVPPVYAGEKDTEEEAGSWIAANRRAPLVWSTIAYTGNARNYTTLVKNIDWLAENYPMYEYAVLDGWLAQHNDGSTAPNGCYEYNENGYPVAPYQEWYDNGYTFESFAKYCLERDVIPGVYYNPQWLYKRTAADVDLEGNSKGVNPTAPGTDIPLSDIINTGASPIGTSEGRNGRDLAEFQSWWYVDPAKEGAKEYMQGMIQYFKDMGYGFMKIDFLRQGHYFYGQEAMEQCYQWWREAAGDDFILSFANARQVDYLDAELKYADMNRITADTSSWNRVGPENRGRIQRSEWDTTRNTFDGYNYFAEAGGEGPGAGVMVLDGDHTRTTQLTATETETVIALKVLGGGGIQMSDRFSDSVGDGVGGMKPWAFTNENFLELVYEGFYARPLKEFEKRDVTVRGNYNIAEQTYEPKTQIWAGQAENGDWIVGLFNREDTEEERSIDFYEDLGLDTAFNALDLWKNEQVGTAITGWSETLPGRGCRILRLSQPEYVEISETSLELAVNGGTDSARLTAMAHTTGGEDTSVVWASSNPAVATVSDNGLVKALAPGSAMITATSVAKPELVASCDVQVYDFAAGVTGLTLSHQTAELLLGGSLLLGHSIEPATAWDRNVTWQSSNENVAVVDNGLVAAAGLGTATIRCTSMANPSVFAECTVEVVPSVPESGEVITIALSRNVVSMLPGKALALTATVENAGTDDGVIWSSLDESVATVSSSGLVTVVGQGVTTVVARSRQNEKYAAHCVVYGAGEDAVYETEDSKGHLQNGTTEKARSAFSGGKGTGNIGNSATRYLLMDVEAPEDGLYNLGVYYAQNKDDTAQDTGLVPGGASRSIYITADGGTTSHFLVMQGTIASDFTRPEQEPATTTVALKKGTNEIKLFNNNAWAPDLDKVTLAKAFPLVGVAGNIASASNKGDLIQLTQTVVSGTLSDLEDYATALAYTLYRDGEPVATDEVEGQTGQAPGQSTGGVALMNGFVYARSYEAELDKREYTVPGEYSAVFTAEKNGVTVQSEPLYLFTIPGQPGADKTTLEELAGQARELEAEQYTEESWAQLAAALERAEQVLAAPDAGQQEVDEAAEALGAALDGLVLKEPEETIPVESVSITGPGSVKRNKTLQLEAMVTPENATHQTVTWTVLNPAVASIDENGLLTAGGKAGFAIVQATAENGVSAQIMIEITA